MLIPSNIAETGNEIANTISSRPGPTSEVLVEGIMDIKIKIMVNPQ